jgi:uncharacterized protein YdhG (YjbR/CyaY superfamily)
VNGGAEASATEDERSKAVTRQFATIDEYISAFPTDVQLRLEQVRQTARNAAPTVGETISYAMPTFTLNGRDLLRFAAWKRYISLYPLPALDDAFAQELAPYRAAKSTAHFSLAEPIPREIIARLVKLLVAQRGNIAA